MKWFPVIVRGTALQAACLFFIFIAASCASIPVHFFPDGRQVPADFIGVVHAGKSGTDAELQQLNYLDAKWTLHSFDWHRIEVTQGEWDFSLYDTIADNCKAADMKIIAVLGYDIPWIHKEGHRKRYIPPDKVPFFLQYVRKTVEHFRGRVDAWAIWNEPNFYFWNGPEKEFIELSRMTADAVREVDNDVILLGGGFNAFPLGLPVRFIKNLFKSGALEKVDYISFHPYDTSVTRSVLLYERHRKIADEFGFGDKIWITEMGFPTGGWYPHRLSLNKLPEAVVKVYAHFAYAGAKNVLWYQLYDPEIRNSSSIKNSEDYFGLIRSTADPASKAAEAFRLCALYMPDTTCYVLTPEQDKIPGQLQAFWFKGEKTSALVLWKDGGGTSRLNIRLSGTDHLRHDIVTGSESAVPEEFTVQAGSDPVFITWQVDQNSSERRPLFLAPGAENHSSR